VVDKHWFLVIASTGIFGAGAALLPVIVNIVIVAILLILLYLTFLSLGKKRI